MTYTKQTWVDGLGGGTPLSAGRLGHLEDGLVDAHNALDGRLSDAALRAAFVSPATYRLRDFANLQAAIDACAAGGGGVVQLPAGATPVSASIQMKSKVILAGPPCEWSVWGYGPPNNPRDFQAAWLEADASTTDPVVVFASTVFDSGIRDLMVYGAPTRNGIELQGASMRGGCRLRNVYVNNANVGIIVGQQEVRLRDVSVMSCAGDGIQWNAQDGEYIGGVVGYNVGHGIVLGQSSGPIRMQTIDSFYSGTGAGIVIDGFGHMIDTIQVNNNWTNGIIFRTAQATSMTNLVASGNGQAFATTGTRYADVLFAHPTVGNLGCAIQGGAVFLPSGSGYPTKMAVESTEAVPGIPTIANLYISGAYAAGTSPTALVSMARFNFRGCTNVPDTVRPQGGLAPQYVLNGTDVDQVQFTNGSTVYSGVRERGAIYGAVVSVSASASATPSLDAKTANIWNISLTANITSTTITNPKNGQRLTINFTQDATGGRTYVWPTNCKFAGAAAPTASTAAFRRDSVTFISDGTNWIESARAIGIAT